MNKNDSYFHCFISGRVQGVFFRASTQRKANELGIAGWVRNVSDGRVEVTASSDPRKLNTFIEWLHHGPATARVDNIEFIDSPEIELSNTDFIIR